MGRDGQEAEHEAEIRCPSVLIAILGSLVLPDLLPPHVLSPQAARVVPPGRERQAARVEMGYLPPGHSLGVGSFGLVSARALPARGGLLGPRALFLVLCCS